eukprot:m.184880 g.184880  ORF g.184880 m.184880 type:complete len:67 (+) comp21559_c0_seq3:67-267(+)
MVPALLFFFVLPALASLSVILNVSSFFVLVSSPVLPKLTLHHLLSPSPSPFFNISLPAVPPPPATL